VEKYNQLVMEDEQEQEQEYENEYRGHVQNRRVEMDFQPMFALSYMPQQHEVNSRNAYDEQVEQMNTQLKGRQLYISNTHTSLDDAQSAVYFQLIDTLSHAIETSSSTVNAANLLLQRAVAYSMLQNFEAAIEDLSTYLYIDSTSVLALWQRAACQMRINRFQASQGTNVQLQNASVRGDLTHALELSPDSPWLLYNLGTMAALQQDYAGAVDYFTAALSHDPSFAEAYFNRGLCRLYLKQQQEAVLDLSKAGELGLYHAYSLIKKNNK
jgi:tetratricopeptide (TPR) repeat protein